MKRLLVSDQKGPSIMLQCRLRAGVWVGFKEVASL